MRRLCARVFALAAILLALGAAPPRSALAAGGEEDYLPFEARITDVQGVVTDCFSFGYATGSNVLLAHRGEADVDIPFRLVRVLEIGAYVPEKRRAPATVVLTSGKSIAIEIDATEEGRLMAGECDFGSFRIRLGKVRRIEVAPPPPPPPAARPRP
jgi:hypothetical protein